MIYRDLYKMERERRERAETKLKKMFEAARNIQKMEEYCKAEEMNTGIPHTRFLLEEK